MYNSFTETKVFPIAGFNFTVLPIKGEDGETKLRMACSLQSHVHLDQVRTYLLEKGLIVSLPSFMDEEMVYCPVELLFDEKASNQENENDFNFYMQCLESTPFIYDVVKKEIKDSYLFSILGRVVTGKDRPEDIKPPRYTVARAIEKELTYRLDVALAYVHYVMADELIAEAVENEFQKN